MTEIPVVIVLSEDWYETRFGDGYYAYCEGAFPTREEAEAFGNHHTATTRCTTHLRRGRLVCDRDTWTLVTDEPLEAGERLDCNSKGTSMDCAALARAMLERT